MAAASRPAVLVVVLGDWGRSPRMQYHALSLAEAEGRQVFVVAYAGARPAEAVADHPRIRLLALPPPPRLLASLPRLLALPLKALFQLAALLWALLVRAPRASHLLLQTPPCIPTFAACQLACALRRARLVLDWHNFGYTLMALSLPRSSPLLRAAERYERALGWRAHAHLCVTRAMAAELARPAWGVPRAVVLHDRPAARFARCRSAEEAHALLLRVDAALAASAAATDTDWAWGEVGGATALRTALTRRGAARRAASFREDRPVLLVSSTSWTADEDFGMLLDALELYDAAAAGGGARRAARAASPRRASAPLPRLLVVVTGSGPLRAAYEARARALRLRCVALRTAWLAAEEYSALLGCADLGLSLHASSSGLDLPMKVVDMFGAALPVLALGYPTLRELVQPGVSGELFSDAGGLAAQLRRLLAGFDGAAAEGGMAYGTAALASLRRGAAAWGAQRWEGAWAEHAAPLFRDQ